MFADVTSANVVGYQNVTRPARYQNSCGGSLFLTPGSNTYSLADLKISVEDPANDRNNYIVFMDEGSTMKVNKDRAYWWDSAQSVWRVRNGTTKSRDDYEYKPEEVLINPGEGFLCNFAQDNTKITYSGEVITGNLEKKLIITPPEGIQNFVACNIAGRLITLKELTFYVEDSANDRNNYIVFMDEGSTMKVNKDRAYWWDSAQSVWRVRNGTTKSRDDYEYKPEEVLINPGEGFLCNFAQPSTTLTLPTAL